MTIYDNSPVSASERNGDAWILTIPQGVVRAASVVLAIQAYTDVPSRTLAPRIARTNIPILYWQVATEPLGDNLRARIVPGRQAVSDTRADLRFLRYDARNRLITGGTLISSSNAESKPQALVGARMAETFPELGAPSQRAADPKPIAFHAIGRKVAPDVLAWYRRKDRVKPSV